MDEKRKNRMEQAVEELNRAAHESYQVAVNRAFDAQKSNMRLSRRFFENWVETLEHQAEQNRRTAQELAELVREQQEVFRWISRESGEAYDGFVDSLASYYDDVSKELETEGR